MRRIDGFYYDGMVLCTSDIANEVLHDLCKVTTQSEYTRAIMSVYGDDLTKTFWKISKISSIKTRDFEHITQGWIPMDNLLTCKSFGFLLCFSLMPYIMNLYFSIKNNINFIRIKQ